VQVEKKGFWNTAFLVKHRLRTLRKGFKSSKATNTELDKGQVRDHHRSKYQDTIHNFVNFERMEPRKDNELYHYGALDPRINYGKLTQQGLKEWPMNLWRLQKQQHLEDIEAEMYEKPTKRPRKGTTPRFEYEGGGRTPASIRSQKTPRLDPFVERRIECAVQKGETGRTCEDPREGEDDSTRYDKTTTRHMGKGRQANVASRQGSG